MIAIIAAALLLIVSINGYQDGNTFVWIFWGIAAGAMFAIGMEDL